MSPAAPRRPRLLSDSALGHAEAVLDGLTRYRRRGASRGLNGQLRRQEVVEAILAAFPPELIVETGTHRGATARWLAEHSAAPVHTVEAADRYYAYASRRFRRDARVVAHRGDSAEVLARLAADPGIPKRGAFFYLDAHWYERLPLADEVRTIGSAWRDSLFLVDDFEVPGDPGYGFDDYGPAGKLCLENLPLDSLTAPAVFWPRARSEKETGYRRGWVVVAWGDAAAALEALPGLRR